MSAGNPVGSAQSAARDSHSTSPAPTITGIALTHVRVSPKTIWLFVEVTDADGAVGVGEATLQREESQVAAALSEIAPMLLGHRGDPQALASTSLDGQTRAVGAALSALDHALWDLTGQRSQRSVARLLVETPAGEVELYANVNRGLASRAPAAFANGVRAAIDAGFGAVKIAPFDEIDTFGHWGSALAPTARCFDLGMDRIAAARAAAGPAVDLMVDCHWRFDEAWALRVVDACAPLRLYWIECPIPEHDANLPALKRLRGHANGHGMRLAGGEDGVGRNAFLPFLGAGAYDVLMPDIKYVGGFDEIRAVAALAAQHGVAIAPHNPTGPVAHAASLHACAGLPGFSRLELQFNETPLFDALVQPLPPRPVGGMAQVPKRPGLGVALVPTVAISHAVDRRTWGCV